MTPSRLTLALCAVALLGACASPSQPPSPLASTPSCSFGNERAERALGFCQAVRAGSLLFISGVPANGPMDSAVPQVYQRLEAILKAHGLGFEHVVKETVFTTDIEALTRANAQRKAFYGSWTPAASWLQVPRLIAPGMVLEVELIAQFPR